MHILTAQQRCTAGGWAGEEVALADHLSHVSLVNKIDFARLHGLTLQVVANPVSPLIWNCCYSHILVVIIGRFLEEVTCPAVDRRHKYCLSVSRELGWRPGGAGKT